MHVYAEIEMPLKPTELASLINDKLDRLMPILAPLGVVLGFFLSGVFIHLRPYVPWIFGLITLNGALRLKVAEFGGTIRKPVPILAFFVSSYALMPLLAFFVSSVVFGDNPDIVAGYVLLFSGPTAVSAFMWVTLFRGDKALALTLILLATMLSPLLIPGTVYLLIGAKVSMNMGSIAVSLILMVVFPTIVGVTLNEVSRSKIPGLICPYLAPVSKICIVIVIAANTSPVASRIRFDNPVIWILAALCVLLSASGFLLSRLAALVVRCNHEKSVAMLFAGGMRNISAITTIAVNFFPEAAALPALLGIMFQQSLAAFMGKLLTRQPRPLSE